MSKFLRFIVKALIAVVVLASIAAAYVLFVIDPNSYKADIEQAAADNGVTLQLKGDLGLSLLPSLAITVGETHFSSEQHQIPPSSIAEASLALDIMALLQKHIAVNALTIKGADIHFSSIGQSAAIAAPASTADAPLESASSEFSVAIKHFTIENSTFSVHGEDAIQTVIINRLHSKNISTTGQPFSLNLVADYMNNGTPITLDISAKTSYSQAEQRLNISTLTGSLAGINIDASLKATAMNTLPELNGSLSLTTHKLKDVLAHFSDTPIVTTNAAALQQFGFATNLAFKNNTLTLSQLKLNIDSTEFTGDLQLDTKPKNNTNALIANITGNQLVVDDYLPPVTHAREEEASTNTANTALFAPLLLPLAILEGGTGTINVAMNSLTAAGTVYSKPQFSLNAKGKRIQLQNLSLGAYGGTVEVNADINLKGDQAHISFNKTLKNIDLLSLQQQMGSDASLGGTLSMSIKGSTRGNSQQTLLNNASARGQLTIDKLQLTTINLEQSYCQLAAMVERTPKREEPWPAGTALTTLNSNFSLKGPLLKLEDYSTGVGSLSVRGSGIVDLDAQGFAIKVITKLQGERTSETGCTIKSKRIRNRDIPLLCKDSFANAGATSCKPDPDFVKSLLKKELLNQLLDKGSSKTGGVGGLLKGLFK